MDLTDPLRSLVPTLDSAVLEVLAGTQSGLSGVQVARLARRGSRTGQRPVLDRLVEHGLVLAERSNTGFLYRLNREHLLVPVVLGALGARAELIDRLAGAARALGEEAVHVSVFGSFARGEAGPESDIDIFVLRADPPDREAGERGTPDEDDSWHDRVQGMQSRVLAWTGNRAEVLVLTESVLAAAVAGREPVLGTWSRDAVTLLGSPPARLLALAAERSHGGAVQT